MENELLINIVFSDDEKGKRAAKKIYNSRTIEIKRIEDAYHLIQNHKNVAIVHIGNRITSELAIQLSIIGTENECNLGFICHPRSLDHLLHLQRKEPKYTSQRSAILNHVDKGTYEIDNENYWYGSGSKARLFNLIKWQHDETNKEDPLLTSFVTHSREDLMFAIDGIMCSHPTSQLIIEKENTRLPSCFYTGQCYRDDLKPYNVEKFKSKVFFLNGCKTFQLGEEIYNSESSLVYRLIDNGAINIIGSPLAKMTGYVEEAHFIHSELGERSIGEINRRLNLNHVKGSNGIPPFLLWGDPRNKFNTLDTMYLNKTKGFIDYNYTTNSQQLHNKILDLNKSYINITNNKNLNIDFKKISGQISQLDSLIRGINKYISKINFIKGGGEFNKVEGKIKKAEDVIFNIEVEIVNTLVELNHEKGFNFSENYREFFWVTSTEDVKCDNCLSHSYLHNVTSPYGLSRKIYMCPKCGIYKDEPAPCKTKTNITVEYKEKEISLVGIKPNIPTAVSVHKGERYGFSNYLFRRKSNHTNINIKSLRTVKPYQYEIKVFWMEKGELFYKCIPFYFSYTDEITYL